MTRQEALTLLNLTGEFEKESLRLNYHTFFISAFRKKSSALTVEEADKCTAEIIEINKAFSILDNSSLIQSDEILLDFRKKELNATQLDNISSSEVSVFVSFVEKMIRERREGLALSLLEIGIELSLKESNGFKSGNLNSLMPLLGQLLIEMGLLNQGVKYLTFNKGYYEKAMAYKKIGDYKMAAHYFALELPLNESKVPIDEICQHISICYFLLNDYENSLKIIEDVLPKLVTSREIFNETCKSKKFATSVMVSMYRLNEFSGKAFDALKIRLKYPLCFKYLQKCFGKIESAWEIIKSFEKNSEQYDDFLKSLKPKPFVQEELNLYYDLQEISDCYSSIFNQPLNKSLIYHPK